MIESFEHFRKRFGGTKRGYETELKVFQKHKDWKTCLPFLLPAIETEIKWREEAKAVGIFVPSWKNMQTWLNQRCWEQEFQQINPPARTNNNQPISTHIAANQAAKNL